MKLAGKVAIVGGASRGIGKDMALAFAAEGAKVVVVARSEVEPDPRLPGTIHQTVDEIKTAGGEAIAVKADISDEAQVDTMAKSALDAYGRSCRAAFSICRPGILICTIASTSKARFCVSALCCPLCSSSNRDGLLAYRHARQCSQALDRIRTLRRRVPLCTPPLKPPSNVSPRS